MSSGRKALPADRVLDRRNQHAQAHLQLRIHHHAGQRQHVGGAAHVLLHDQHAARRLQIEPAGVEADALADQRHLGMAGIAPGDVDQPRRTIRGHADGVDQWKVRFEILADGACVACAELGGELLRGRGQLLRPHVVGRRVDEVARQHRGIRHAIDLGGVDAVRRHQPDVGAVRLAVTGEAVAAEREGERRQSCIVRCIGKAIGARRQQARQCARPERIARSGTVVLEPEQHLRDRRRRARAVRDSRPAWRQRRSRWRTGVAPAAASRARHPSSIW